MSTRFILPRRSSSLPYKRGCTMAILRRPVGHLRISMHTPGVYTEYTSGFHVKINRREQIREALLGTMRFGPARTMPKRIDRHRDGYRSLQIPVCFRVPTKAESWQTPVILSHLRRSAGCNSEWMAGRKGAPFPCPRPSPPSLPLTLRSFAGYSASTQGQLKLTAIYCISIMVSPISPSPRRLRIPRPFPRLLLHRRRTLPSLSLSSSLHVRVQHESSGCTVDLLRALGYTPCESTQKYPTANYPSRGARLYRGNCIIPRKLSTRA